MEGRRECQSGLQGLAGGGFVGDSGNEEEFLGVQSAVEGGQQTHEPPGAFGTTQDHGPESPRLAGERAAVFVEVPGDDTAMLLEGDAREVTFEVPEVERGARPVTRRGSYRGLQE